MNGTVDAASRDVLKQGSSSGEYDFGWSRPAYAGPWLFAAVLLAAAVLLQLHWPALWAASFALVALAINSFVGGLLLRTSDRPDYALLPMVDLLRSDDDRVLDAGCGAGRTTLAIGKVLAKGRITAFDRFDSGYIDGGGRALLDRNLRIAGLASRVGIVTGDLARRLPFPDAHFDAAVSTHVIDHLGPHKQAALAELNRVLKPGGRLLMVVWVPGWATFALGNVFSLLLTSKSRWRALAAAAGFAIRDEGHFNGMWFALLERPQ